MEFPKIIRTGTKTVRLFNWMDYPRGQAARNVECLDGAGQRLWLIQSLGSVLPASDYYTDISYENGRLHAFNYSCYRCEIDMESGEIIQALFTK